MFQLPQEIQNHIYEYDATHREIYDNIMTDLQNHLDDYFRTKLATEYADYTHSVDRYETDAEWGKNGYIFPIAPENLLDLSPADYWYCQYSWQLTDAECREEGYYDE
jgi:hypothetical protein